MLIGRLIKVVSLLIILLGTWSGYPTSQAKIPKEDQELSPLEVNRKKEGQQRVYQGKQQELSDLVEEEGLSVRRAGGIGSRSMLSIRGGGGHQLEVNLEGVPLQGSLSQGFDLSMFPSFTLDAIEVNEGVLSGESGAQTAQLTLRLPKLQPGTQGKAQLAFSSERGTELGAWAGRAGSQGGVGAWLSGGGGSGAFTYRDRYDLLQRRLGASYLRGSAGVIGAWRIGKHRLSSFTSFSSLQRGEPGPEGQENYGGNRDQQSVLLSIKFDQDSSWNRKDLFDFLIPQTQIFVHQKSDLYQEEMGLWQNTREQAYLNETWDSGFKLAWIFRRFENQDQYLKNRFNLQLNTEIQGRWEQVKLYDGLDEESEFHRYRLSITPTFQVGRTVPWIGIMIFKSALRLDLNTERPQIWVPSVAMQIRPQSWFYCEARMSSAFRDPSFDERYVRGSGILPNPSLRSEDGWWADLGCTFKKKVHRMRSKLSLLTFKQSYDRLILFIPLDPYRIQASDAEGASVHGLTLEGQSSLRFVAPWPIIKIDGRLTIQEHHLTSAPYTPLPLRPLYEGWSRATFLLRPSEFWLKYIQRSPLYADRYGLRTLSEISLVHLGLSRTWRTALTQRIKVDVSMRNIFDARRRDAILRPLPGRSVWIHLSFEGH